jgi:hypothetical protein
MKFIFLSNSIQLVISIIQIDLEWMSENQGMEINLESVQKETVIKREIVLKEK